jgi:hypothetical protein
MAIPDAIWDRGVDGIVLASMYTFRASMPKGSWPAPVCSSTLSPRSHVRSFQLFPITLKRGHVAA